MGRDPTRRLALFVATLGGHLMWGVLALPSPGTPLLAASIPACVAAALLVRSPSGGVVTCHREDGRVHASDDLLSAV